MVVFSHRFSFFTPSNFGKRTSWGAIQFTSLWRLAANARGNKEATKKMASSLSFFVRADFCRPGNAKATPHFAKVELVCIFAILIAHLYVSRETAPGETIPRAIVGPRLVLFRAA